MVVDVQMATNKPIPKKSERYMRQHPSIFIPGMAFYFWDFPTGFLSLSVELPICPWSSQWQTVMLPTAPHVTAELHLSDLRIWVQSSLPAHRHWRGLPF